MLKKTPLYQAHLSYGGDMVEFAGYLLPIRYNDYGVIAEHNAVRQKAGLFDVSHMGELAICGKNAEAALNTLLTNDITGMYDGQVRYSVLANAKGGAIDDVLVYRFNGQRFWLVVNAANAEKDINWIKSNLPSDVMLVIESDDYAQLALQGPCSKDIMLSLANEDDIPKKYYSFLSDSLVGGVKCIVSRTGYTGEFGYELYCNAADALNLYNAIMEKGKDYGIAPAGLGARDTLRLEAGMPLYGHEMSEDIPVAEVGLDFAIKLDKDDFIGKNAIKNHTAEYARVGATVVKGIARQDDIVFCGDTQVGVVTSGTHSPTLGCAIAVLRIKKEYVDKPLTVLVRGRNLSLQTTPLPFYKK